MPDTTTEGARRGFGFCVACGGFAQDHFLAFRGDALVVACPGRPYGSHDHGPRTCFFIANEALMLEESHESEPDEDEDVDPDPFREEVP
ncbi:MAG TPA: hypothetical protein VEY12_04355 [Thermoplasmata archaeon]|nr:hypothetical protein [Thermoplasmata archaeon]